MELGQSTEIQNDVMVLLAKHVIATVANGSNFVFSPMSVNLLLCLIAAGSSCVSKQQILTFLMSPSSDHLNAVLAKMVSVVHANGTERSDLRLSMATGVWIDQSLSVKPSFKEVLENSFKGNCSHVDFFNKFRGIEGGGVELGFVHDNRQEDEMRLGCSELKTFMTFESGNGEGTPAEVIDEVNTYGLNSTPIDSSRRFFDAIPSKLSVIANSYLQMQCTFKGAWGVKFDPKLTEDNDFHLLDGTSVKVPFMTNEKSQYLKGYDGFQVLCIPYVEDDQREFSMYIYLPNDKNGLPALLEKIGSEPRFFDNHLTRYHVSVDSS
ncbi:hypothetical protein DY000_02055708 [Brassica cretica]|uniref:Serpin domain-containing protein n=1 Tax=Brassica cretica TaxID=69181 RepID=A0ABQ7AAP0_BRACR|nr:hypothetical protein DY000_02055708 [Brassica cretica]